MTVQAMNQEFVMPELGSIKDHWVKVSEDGVVGIIANVVPWLAFVPNAYFVYESCDKILHLPIFVCWVIAIVIESMGVATIHTCLKIYMWNQGHTPEKRSPFALSVILAVVYVVVVVALIVVLKVYPELAKFAPAIFPALAITAAILLAVRHNHNKQIKEEGGVKVVNDMIQKETRQLTNTLKVAERLAKIQNEYGVAYDLGTVMAGGHVQPQARGLIQPDSNFDSVSGVNHESNVNQTESTPSDESKVVRFYIAYPQAKQRAAATATGLSQSKISRILNQLESSGAIQRNQDGVVVVNQNGG